MSFKQNKMAERCSAVPLYSSEAEQAVLGGFMLDNKAWDKIADRINEDDFYRPEHQIIFRAIKNLAKQGKPFDMLIVVEELKSIGELENVGGESYVFEIANNTPTAINIEAYCNVVLEKSRLRKLQTIGRNLQKGTANGADYESIIAFGKNALEQLEAGSLQDIPAPISLDNRTLPTIDKELLPSWLGEMVFAVAEATETPIELAAMVALAVLSTCCHGKFIVNAEGDYCEPLNIWTLVALESGNRKSSVVKLLTSPLVEYEREQAEKMQPQITSAISKKKTIESKIARLRKQAAGKTGTEFLAMQNDIEKLEQSIPEIPVPPRLWAQDITPENLGIVMAEHGERMAIISPEGGIVEMMAGRYSGGIPNIDIYLNGHARDAVKVDRNNRPSIFMDNPALTLGIAPQPDVLRSLASKREFKGRGLLARFLYALPKSNLGARKCISRPIPEDTKCKYAAALKRLLEIKTDKPLILKLNEYAYRHWKDYSREIEADLKDGSRFEHIKDWAGKLPGAVIRIAGLFHCVSFADIAYFAGDNPESLLIDEGAMIKAMDLAEMLIEHALAVFDLMQADPNLSGARKILGWIKNNKLTSFSVRDCFNALRGTFKQVKFLMPALEILIEHGYIFKQELEKSAGRPSIKFTVNPHVRKNY